MLRSVRTRLIVTVIALVAVTAILLGALSYGLVRRSLRSQLVDDAVARTEFNIGVLATTDVLPAGATREELEDSALVDRFLLRGTTGVYVEFPGSGEPFATSLALVDAGSILAPELRRIVDAGEIGYEFLDLVGEPSLVVAGRRPAGGPDFYFVFSAAAVQSALDQLRSVLVGAGLGVVLVGALVAGVIARTVLRPVREASVAARRMTTGDLDVRVPTRGGDEFADLAGSFNAMAASLRQKIEQLEQSQARERRFVADVSHELRTPLTALVNEAAAVEATLHTLPAEQRRIGELLIHDVGRLRRLVDELLEVSRLDTSPDLVDPVEIDVEAFLSAVVAERHPDAELRVAGERRRVSVDRVGLERIVSNLLDNARTHAPGSAVWVDAWAGADELVITVADDGPGVAAEALPHLFDRFYKADPSRQGGTGLGLAIVAQHVRRLGGRLEVRPRPGRGLVFEVRLPVTTSLPHGDEGENLQSDAEGEKRR